MNITRRKSLALVGAGIASAVLSACATDNREATINSTVNYSVNAKNFVQSSHIAVAFDRTLFGVSLKITGDVQYNLTAKGNVRELHKAVLRMAVNTAVKMSDIDSGKVFVSGALVSGDEKVSASDVFDGKDGEVEVKNIIQKTEG